MSFSILNTEMSAINKTPTKKSLIRGKQELKCNNCKNSNLHNRPVKHAHLTASLSSLTADSDTPLKLVVAHEYGAMLPCAHHFI